MLWLNLVFCAFHAGVAAAVPGPRWTPQPGL